MAVKAKHDRSPLTEARSNGETGAHEETTTQPQGQAWAGPLLEAGWLTAAVITPLLFSSYSPRPFASAKIVFIQYLAVFMLLVWLVQAGLRWLNARQGRAPAAPAADGRPVLTASPLVLVVLYLALVYVVTSLTSIAPRLSLWGSYQRLEGAATTLGYCLIFLLTAAYLRRQEQAERLVTAILLASWPVCLFGLAQHFGLDPIPWTGENRPGLFSTLGHPLYLAAYLCIVVPLTLYRLGQVGDRVRRGGRRTAADGFLLLGLVVLLALQVVTLLFTYSRGPTVGLLAALAVMFLAWAFQRDRRGLVLGLAGVALVAGLLVIGLAVRALPAPSRTDPLAQSPLARLTRLVDTRGSVGFRFVLWNSTVTLMEASPVRLLLGYGPETFGNVVLPYYSPATVGSVAESLPDRAHNITLDVLSTTGLLGLVAHLLLYGGVLLTGLGSLGMLAPPQARLVALACLLAGSGLGALAPRLLLGGWTLSGLGFSLGLVAGLFLFLILRILLWRGQGAVERPSSPLTVALLAAVVAHLVDISFAFRMPTTQLYFWLFAALLVRSPWSQTEAAKAPTTETSLTLGSLLALALTTLAYDFGDPNHLNAPRAAFVGPLLMALTFALAATTASHAGSRERGSGKGFLDSPAAPWLVAAYLFGAYWLTRLPLEWLGGDANALLVHYAVWLTVLVAVLAWGRAGRSGVPRLARADAVGYGLGGLVLLAAGWVMLRPLQADVFSTLGRLAVQAQNWDQGLAYFQRSLGLLPEESYYQQQASKAMLDRALATTNPTEKEAWFQRGAAALESARGLAPYALDPVFNSAQYYVAWAQATSNQRLRSERADTALAYCEQSKRMIGTMGDIHLTCGLAQEVKANYAQALAEYQRALELNRTLVQAYVQMGNVYRLQGDVQKAVGAYQTALARQPSLSDARRRLVSLYLEQGDLTSALREAQAAVAARPSDFEARRDLIGVYIKLGQMKEALREALAAQDVAPPDQRATLAKLIEELKAQQ